MWIADSSHFISHLTTTLKYIATLSLKAFRIAPYPNSFASNSHSAFSKILVWIPLEFLKEGCSFFFTLKDLKKVVGSKFIAIKVRGIYLFVILAKHGNTLQCEELVVYVYIFIYICIYVYIRTYTNNHQILIVFCQIQLLYLSTNSQSIFHYTITSTVVPSHT